MKLFFSFCVFTLCAVSAIEAAYCSRCVKIESERAKEQIDQSNKTEYYEDQEVYSNNHSKVEIQ